MTRAGPAREQAPRRRDRRVAVLEDGVLTIVHTASVKLARGQGLRPSCSSRTAVLLWDAPARYAGEIELRYKGAGAAG
jgi:hypothetical protein